MRPASTETNNAAHLNPNSERQNFQNPKTRRVYAIENNPMTMTNESKDAVDDVFKLDSTEIQTVNEENQPNHNESQEKSVILTKRMKNFVFNKIQIHAIQVSIRCIFLRVGEIDTLNERYYAEILMEASWVEPSLKNLHKRTFDPAVNWTPDLELMNSIGNINDEVTYSVRYDKTGQATVTEHHRLKGTLWERMELQHFPFDVQELSLSITTSRDSREVIFVRNERKMSGVNRRVFTDEQEWYLFEHVDIDITERLDEYFDAGHSHPVVICSCHAARKYGYFMWNAFFLIFLITSASFTTFPIPLSSIQGRVQIACTLLLTSITFRWLCNKALPTISYLTTVDVYAIGSIFSLCLLNIYHGVIGYINYYSSTNTTGPIISVPSIIVIDRWALVVFTILFFTYQVGTLIWMFSVPLKKRRRMFRKDNQNRLQMAAKLNNPKATFIDLLRGSRMNESTGNTHSVSANES